MTNVGSPALLGAGRLDGRRAVITGGSRGVGRAIAQALVDAGARVVLVGRDEATLRVAVAQLGEAKNAELGEAKNAELGEAKNAELGEANATFRVTDLGNRSAVQQLADFLVAEDPPIDFLVNNAGLAESAPLGRTSDDLWDRTFALDVTAPFVLTRALVPGFVKRGFGRVINVASNAGLTGYAYTSAYTAAKHALVGLTRAVAMEVAGAGDVTVNALCPGFLDTDLTRASIARISEKTGRSEAEAHASLAKLSPQNRLLAPAEVAFAVRFLCSPLARGINGQALPLDGGQVMK